MEWCLNCLRSSLRELRITAGRTLTAFLHGDLPSEICKTNCYIGLEFMHSRFDKDEPSLQETYILALSAIAQVSEDEEMNIILDRFLNYLGHANPYIVGVVFNELQKLGKLAKETPLGLLRPFWRTLAITAVNSLQRRPQIAQQLSDFLNLGIDEWLMLTEVYVLPHLVLAGKADLIAKMAARRELSTFALCTNKENLAAILAFLLALPSSDPATTILRTLGNICEEFSTSNLSELARIEPILTACNLLKSAAEAGDGQANKVCLDNNSVLKGKLILPVLPSSTSPGDIPSPEKHICCHNKKNRCLRLLHREQCIRYCCAARRHYCAHRQTKQREEALHHGDWRNDQGGQEAHRQRSPAGM